MTLEQTTSLRTKIYESSLKWSIENFLDYDSCDIGEISSETIKFDDTDAEWSMRLHPCLITSAIPAKLLRFNIIFKDNEVQSQVKRLLKAEVKVEPFGHQLMSPANRHLVRSKGFYAEPELNEAVICSFDYRNVGEFFKYEDKLIFPNEKFVSYLDAGALTIFVNVWIKTVEICNFTKKL